MAKLGTEKKPIILRVQNKRRANEVADVCEKHGWIYLIGIESDKPEDISDMERLLNPTEPAAKMVQVGRNEPCPCGSGKKYKNCCLMKDATPGKEFEANKDIPRCGLCGKTNKLTKTECCGHWICDDEANYKLFSYERNSCYRNHRRYTLCGSHYASNHSGRWQDCKKCKDGLDTEMYVYFGTNEYNFEKLENPPKVKPKKCIKCGATIRRGSGGYSVRGKEYWCEDCTNQEMAKLMFES
jgi:SWIM/SEC-C metal-binding protein